MGENTTGRLLSLSSSSSLLLLLLTSSTVSWLLLPTAAVSHATLHGSTACRQQHLQVLLLAACSRCGLLAARGEDAPCGQPLAGSIEAAVQRL
jgi:hypothetical protein